MEKKVSFTRSLLCTLVLVSCCHNLLLVNAQDTTTCRPQKCCKSNRNCAECKKGYFGPSCTRPCRFPNYGVDCQSKCECEQQQCDHTTGCKNIQTRVTAEVLLSGHVTKLFLQNESYTKQIPQTTKLLLIATNKSTEFPMSSVDSTHSLDKRTTNASNDPSYDSKHTQTGLTFNVKTNAVPLVWNVTNGRTVTNGSNSTNGRNAITGRNESKVNETSNGVIGDECNGQWTCMNSRKTAMLICFSVFGFLLLVIIGISVVVITKQNV